MYKQYLFPLYIFLIFEKTSITLWSSKNLTQNHFILMLDHKWLYAINQLFRNEVCLNNSILIENTAIDLKYYNQLSSKLDFFFKKTQLAILYSYYFFLLKLRLTILINLKSQPKGSLNSLDFIYKNANWLEREVSEMYGIFYIWKTDTRKLLLDYSKLENPMLKDFPCEGIYDVFYNFFENQVNIQKNEIIEL